MNTTFTLNQYAVASNLKGFKSETLRVKIVRIASASQIVVRTADLLDSGTALVLSPEQLKIEEPEMVLTHKNGLVAF